MSPSPMAAQANSHSITACTTPNRAILRGTITNNETRLEIASDTIISGSGSIQLTNHSIQNQIVGISTISVLENGPMHSIIGSGRIGQGSLRISNFGTIESQDDTGMTFRPSTLQLSEGGNLANQAGGRIIAGGRGGLRFDSGIILNRAGGEIKVDSLIEIDEFAALLNEPGGLIIGNGFIISDVSDVAIHNNGTWSPGDSIGVLTILGDCMQSNSANIEIEIGPDNVNRDGSVNLLDVAPFVDLVLSGQFDAVADFNFDEVVNLLDVVLFVKALNP